MAVPVFMVITGYVSALSFTKRKIDLKSAYQPREIVSKMLRFIIPFFPAYILSTIAMIVGKHESLSVYNLVKWFVTGGAGPGGYYFPVMLQVVILIPLIFFCVDKNSVRGLVICFVFNVGFEVIKTMMNLSPDIYRLCAFRYIFVLAYGVFLYTNKKSISKIGYYATGILGITYIILFNYTSLKPLITKQWTTTSVFAVLFIVPIMMFLMQPNKLHNYILELLGKASFNIFLVQMIYYLFAPKLIYPRFDNVVAILVFNIVVCCFVGVVFYAVETPITKKVIKSIRKYDIKLEEKYNVQNNRSIRS